MKTHRITIGIAAALAVVALAGCSNPHETSSTSASGKSALPSSCKEKNPVIGVALPNTVNPGYIAMQQGFQDGGKEQGLTVKMAIANDSDSTQLAQIKSFAQQGVCAVALNGVNSGPAASAVKALNSAGIPVFTINVIIDQKALKAQGASYLQYVGPNQATGGRLMGDAAVKDVGSSAKVVLGVIGDPDQIPTNERDAAFVKALKASVADVTVLPTVNSKVDPNVSRQVTSELLQGHPDINMLFADSGPAVTGAMQAIKQSGKQNQVKLYGFCAPTTKVTGFYKACVAQEEANYGKLVMENVKKYIDGHKVPANVVGPLKVYTSGQTPPPGYVG